jgi:hypothetical protein
MAQAKFQPFHDATSSVVFKSSGAMNGMVPHTDVDLTKKGKAVLPIVATDTGGIWLEEPVVLQTIVVHSGTVTAWIENLDGSADIPILGVTLAVGHNHMDNRMIPAGTILKMKSSGAAIVEVIGKCMRSSYSL